MNKNIPQSIKEKTIQFSQEALAEAQNVSDIWVGTQAGEMIEARISELRSALEEENHLRILSRLGELAQLLNYLEGLSEA